MNPQDPRDEEQKGFGRPWESEDTSETEVESNVVQLPGLETEEPEEPAADTWDTMGGSDRIEEFSPSEYLASSTQEYEGLAADVARAADREWEQQAVSASVAGVGTGMVGFEDVTGRRSRDDQDHEATSQAVASDLTLRVGSALVVFGLFLGSLLLGGLWFAGFVILVSVVAVGELYATLRTIGYRPMALFGILGVTLMGIGAVQVGPLAIGGWAAFLAVMTVLFFSLASRRDPLENTTVTVLGMAWVGLLSFAILIEQGPRPVAFILFVVLLVAFNDVGAYFVGRSFGKRPMAPVVSPNKTLEGFFGGLIGSMVVASILTTFPAWESISIGQGLVAAIVIGLLAPVGDLVESMIKRAIGVKDMGSVLPGHGGMLDRIDSFLFAVPAIVFLFRGFGLL